MLAARQFHAITEGEFGGPLAELGYARAARQKSTWIRGIDDTSEWLSLRLSKWNGASVVGEFLADVGHSMSPPEALSGSLALSLLLEDGTSREHMRLINNSVVLKAMPSIKMTAPQRHREIRDQPYPSEMEIWFAYVDAADVESWMRFIVEHLAAAQVRLGKMLGRIAERGFE